jgi:transcriptional regulator with XRE-family HTH domain
VIEAELYTLETILSTIRSSLSLNMAEMAKIFRVERPTVYAWIGGSSEPHLSNKNRLNKIFSIAKYWESLSNLPVGNLVRQPYSDEKSIVDLLSEKTLDEEQILSHFQFLAENQGNLQPCQSKPSIRELVIKHKINIKESSDTIDWLTGKRIDIE